MRRQRGPKLRVVPRPSVPDKPKPVFAIERFYEVAPDIKPLFKRHWDELGRDRDRVPLDFWWEHAAALDTSGILRIMTVRLEGELIGYMLTLVSPHLHYKSTLHANVDAYWLAPEHRKGWAGVAMIRAHEKAMRALGVKRLFIGENLTFKNKRGKQMRGLLRALGYAATDVHFRKML
jgi:GNAT superfamily N-acetyltransferase